MGRRIYIDLNDQEEADVHGWVNKGRRETDFANYPTRLVLAQRDRARFDQIEEQFPVDVIPPSEPDPNFGVPAGTFSGVVLDSVMRKEDSQERERNIDPLQVYSMPMVLPAKPWSTSKTLRMAIAQYLSVASQLQACISLYPGDFKNRLDFSEGTSVQLSLFDLEALGFGPGTTLYFNVRMWSSDWGRISTSQDYNVRIGGGWPY